MKQQFIPIGLFLGAISQVHCSSILTLKDGSASCSGGLELEFLKTDQTEYTYGSTVYLSGQINALSELPSVAEINVKSSVFGMSLKKIATFEVEPCESKKLMPPAGYDAGYACPEAGFYNFFLPFTLPDDSFYSGWYGFNVGITVDIEGDDGEYATCELIIHSGKGEDSSNASAAFIGFSIVGFAGIVNAAFQKRRTRLRVEGAELGDNSGEIGSSSVGSNYVEMETIQHREIV